MGQNLNLELPDWAKKDDKGIICVKSPMEMYAIKEEKNVNFTHLVLLCTGKCESSVHFEYNGLEDLFSDDTHIRISAKITEYSRSRGYNSISVNLLDKNLIESIKKFFDDAQKAAAYKLDLVKDINCELQFKSGEFNVSMVIKNDGTVLLYELSEKLGNVVPTLFKPRSYEGLLGVVYYFGKDIDLDDIKTGNVSSNKPLLKALFIWVKTLFRSNNFELNESDLSLWVEKC